MPAWWIATGSSSSPSSPVPPAVTGYPDVALELVDHRTFDGRLQMLEYVPTVLDAPPGVGE